MDRKLIHDTENNRFNLQLENEETAYVSYKKNGNHLDLTYSEVPTSLRGKGIGKELVIKTFEKIEEDGYTATAYCSYIRAVATRDPYWSKKIK